MIAGVTAQGSPFARVAARPLLFLIVLFFVGCGSGSNSSHSAPSESNEDLLLSERDSGSTWTVQNRIAHRNGQAMFPLGMYYVSHYAEQKQKRLEDLDTIAQAGFNFIHTPINLEDGNFLDKAASLGVHVAVEFNYEPAEVIATFQGHPAVAFYSSFDDVDGFDPSGAPSFTPEEVTATNAQITAADPNVLTYISGYTHDRFGLFVNRSDVIATQTYPVPDEPLSSTSYTLGLAGNAIGGSNQTFIANLQTFPWHGPSSIPTGDEVRNMTYQALIQGVRGIIYYTFFDASMDMNAYPELWQQLSVIVSELRDIEPFLLHGQRTMLNTGDGEVYAAQWRLGESLLLVVVNTYPRSSPTLSVELSDSVSGPITNKFISRGSGLVPNGTTLTGIMEAREVDVYLIG